MLASTSTVIHGNLSISFVDSSQSVRMGGCLPWSDINFHAWPAGRSMDAHSHDFLQFILVLHGRLDIDWGAGWVQVGPGRVHLLPPGQAHRLRSHGHGQFGINCTTRPDERGLLARLIAMARPGVLDWPAGVRAAEGVHGRPPTTVAGRLAIAAELDRAVLALLADAPPDGLETWLAGHLDHRVDVATAARALRRSRSRLQADCQRRHGCGVAHLHERMRIERAAGLLSAEPDAGIAVIAARAGYPDVFAFSRAFRRVIGAPPGVWRRQRRLAEG